jgi:Fusaric acid resistance protein family
LARQHAGRVVLVMLATLGTWLWFDIPMGPFGVVAASLMATSAIDSTAIRFSQRLLGIILGMCLAIAFTVVFLPQMERIQEFELLVFGIFWLCSFINYGSQKSAFIGLQSSITFAVVLVRDAHQSSDLLPIWQRGRALVLGLVIRFCYRRFNEKNDSCVSQSCMTPMLIPELAHKFIDYLKSDTGTAIFHK